MKTRTWFALLMALSLIAAACGSTSDTTDAPTTEAPTTEAPATTAPPATEAPATTAPPTTEEMMTEAICEVTDVGGVDDKSFNQLAFDGAKAAETELGWEARVLESSAETDYEPNINQFVSSGECNVIVTVGFLLGDATGIAATANPEQQFAIVDFAFDPPYNNVQGLVFSTHQAAFLAGYVAADQTQTGVVGTFGGINVGPPVTDFMEGYALGVQYYNEQKGTDVVVLGWDPATQDGLFTGNFDSLEDGRAFAENLADEGADIILPVAGPVGLGSAAFAQELGTIRIIGVDADWTQTASEYTDVILTSVLKKVDVAVADAARNVADGTTTPFLVSTLESGGVGLAPITNALTDSPDLAAELEAISALIISGEIDTNSAD